MAKNGIVVVVAAIRFQVYPHGHEFWWGRFYASFSVKISTPLSELGGPKGNINRQKWPKMGLCESLQILGFKFTPLGISLGGVAFTSFFIGMGPEGR